MRDNVQRFATKRAQTLRRTLTPAERKLWHALRDRRIQQLKFRRQAPVGAYIADFLCLEHRLIVEADGSQHADSIRDTARDAWFVAHGYKVLRFWNREILFESESVLATIAANCGLSW